jgi:hypothetical protein
MLASVGLTILFYAVFTLALAYGNDVACAAISCTP